MSEAAPHEEPDHLWERMPGESSKVYGKFCAYRDLGPGRSLVKLRRLHVGEEGWSRSALEEACQRWHWQSRAAAWDDEQDRARRQAQLEAIREMAERQARDGADMQRLAKGAMSEWVKPDPQTGQLKLAAKLRPNEVTNLFRVGVDIERTARGEPTVVTEERTRTGDDYDEQRISAGIAFALAQAAADTEGMGGGGAPDSLPASPPTDSSTMDGGAAADSGQAEPGDSAEVEPDPVQA
jgi:hypothetical protein